MGELRLELLGRPRVVCEGTPLAPWTLQKSVALLAYLVVTGRARNRSALAGLLWPDLAEANARSNLRKVVAELRQKIPSHLVITRIEMAFDRGSSYWLDVEAFEQATTRILARREVPLTAAAAAVLGEAMALYRDDFLRDLIIQDAFPFEEWKLLEREHLRNLALRALQALVDFHRARGQPEQALAYLDRMLALEPAQEEAHRAKMLLLAEGGERQAALRQYEACRQALAALDAAPDDETTALYRQIRARSPLPLPARAPRRHLSVPLIPLVGRGAELARILALLRDPECRLLTLVGPGGAGKTHLALEVAAGLLSEEVQFAHALAGSVDDVCVVRLEAIPTAEGVLPAMARALDLRLTEDVPAMRQLVDRLQGGHLLLVMDGLEHLPAAADLLVELLRAVPSLKILATSRARLEVEGEHLLPVQGLACPGQDLGDRQAVISSPAVQLFVARVRRIRPGYEVPDGELAEVARLCHLVDGLPLAIVLAAAWAGMLSAAEIAAHLEGEGSRGLDFLQTEGQDLPPRQRSMRAVFDHSWGLLPAREREVLAGLSVFRASFTLTAAQQVAGASLWELRGLIDRSLLQQTTAGRYAMHGLLRQYTAEKLAGAPDARQAVRDRHAAFYAEALGQWWGDLKGTQQQSVLAAMGAEGENLSIAWEWMVERGQVAHLDQSLAALCYFYKWLGQYQQGECLCRRAVEGLAAPGDSFDPERERVQARARAWEAVFCHRLGRHQEAWGLLQHSLDQLDELASGPRAMQDGALDEVSRAQAFALWRLGNLVADLDHRDPQPFYEQSLSIYRRLDDAWGMASVETAWERNRLRV